MEKHVPVLLHEAVNALNIKPKGIYVDATFGRGGHSRAILEQLDQSGYLYAIDQDEEAIAAASQLKKKYPQLKVIAGNFVNLSALLAIQDQEFVDGILFDLGVSSPQLDNADRGFSYQHNGLLDMRMDKQHMTLTAADVVNQKTLAELTAILKSYGEEPHANLIAQELVNSRPLKTTNDVVNALKRALPAKVLRAKGHPAKRTFQALRIYVNRELDVLKIGLEQSLAALKPQGRLVVISFHSLEEKIIKTVFKQATLNSYDQVVAKLPLMLPTTAEYRLIRPKIYRPSANEVDDNNRSRSAKLWVIERI